MTDSSDPLSSPESGSRGFRTPRSAATRARIFQAASYLFSANGYSSTSLEEVAQEAGVSKATIYYHFQNKDALYSNLVLDHVEAALRFAEGVRAAHGPAIDTLVSLLDYLIGPLASPQKKHLFFDRGARLDPGIRERIRACQRAVSDIMHGLVVEAQRAGQLIDEPAEAITLVLWQCVGRFPSWFAPEARISEAQLIATVRRMTLRAILTDPNLLAQARATRTG